MKVNNQRWDSLHLERGRDEYKRERDRATRIFAELREQANKTCNSGLSARLDDALAQLQTLHRYVLLAGDEGTDFHKYADEVGKILNRLESGE